MMKIVVVFVLVALSVVFGQGPFIMDALSGFRLCCFENRVSPSCSKFCDYNIKVEDIRGAFKNGQCDIQKDFAPYVQCAYNFKNATDCCAQHLKAGEKINEVCYKVCDGSKPLVLDPKMFECPVIQEGFTQCGPQTRN